MPSKPKGRAKSAKREVGPAPEPVAVEIPLVGHASVIDQLKTAMKKGRLGHAFLFVGAEGIGKRRFARHLAQSLLCEKVPAAALSPCLECHGCAMVRAGTHPDLIEVRKPDDKSELPISLIQDLTGQLSLKPACGTRKVAIVDNADDLNEESANGFLKTLEEPPPGSLLILIARSQESQLPTIQSRCQIARFLPLKDDDVASILVALGKVASFDEALPWARAGQGSVSEAIECARPEWVEMVRQMAESLGEQPMNSPRLSSRVLAFIDEAGKESSAKRDRARRLAQRVARLLHDTLCVQSGGGGESLLPADRWDADLLAEMIDRTLDADYHVQRMASFSLVVETWLDDLARLMEGRRLEPIY